MFDTLPSAAIDCGTVLPAVAGGEPVMAVVYTHRLSPWRAACWHVTALLFSVAFVVLYFVLGNVTRVEVSFTKSTVLMHPTGLRSVICEHKCETDLFNVTVVGDRRYDNGNYPELSDMVAAASPFKMSGCEVTDVYVQFYATSQQTPPLFASLTTAVSCGNDYWNTGAMWFKGTYRASPKWYAMIGGPRLYGESAFVRDLFNIAINIAFLIVLVALLARLFCFKAIFTASQETEVDIRLARASLRCASTVAAGFDAVCLFFVALQYLSCNCKMTVYEDLDRNPDMTIAPQYYACLGAMDVCVVLSLVCTKIGDKAFSSM